MTTKFTKKCISCYSSRIFQNLKSHYKFLRKITSATLLSFTAKTHFNQASINGET